MTICNQDVLSAALSLSLISACAVQAVIYLAVALEFLIVYIQGGTILNTQDSDCLHILHVISRVAPFPAAILRLLSLHFQPDWLCSVTSWHVTTLPNQFQQRCWRRDVT